MGKNADADAKKALKTFTSEKNREIFDFKKSNNNLRTILYPKKLA